ncbi:MAG TPA: protein translocase subunit SecD [Hyphomonadaceae bacterium]|nr:protein translocase subunit SecD [Hyphomonadaceae bacterium]
MLLRFPAWKVAIVIVTIIVGIVLALPNVMPEQYRRYFPTGPMNLGLDLKGGASILLEVDPEELRTNKLTELSTAVRETLRQAPTIPVNPANGRRVEGEALVVRLNNATDAPEAIRRIKKLGDPPIGTIGQANSYNVVQRPDGAIEVTFTDAAFDKMQTDALSSSMEAVRRRVDNTGLVEPNIQKQGANRIIVEVPGLDASEMTTLIDTLTQAGVLTFNLVDVNANVADYEVGVPRNGRIALPDDSLNGQVQVIIEDAIIRGSDLSGASQSRDESNRPSIAFQLHSRGAQAFGKTTSQNVGKPFAIVLDNRIVSAPRIISPIMTGNGQITGSFTPQEAEQMAVILRSGALPAKLKVAERRVVDASLGADSIQAGVTATVVGILLISVFMIATYGLLGLFAIIALYFNLVLMLGVLSGFGATMTLPGIAGILLTMGMAVDANVLINERIREEKKAGRSVVSAVDVGFDQAMATIIDANFTHFIAGLVMFQLGSGPIQGFALTLAIGVATSLFTSVMVARFIFALWLKYARPKYIPI